MNMDNFLFVLPKALEGWAGVFIVTAVIILVVVALNTFTKPKNKD